MPHDILSSSFTWAGGIEDTFIPHARPGLRALDEYALTQHYQQWQTDIDLAARTGIQALRWGIPWYKVQPGPNTWDWGWVDEVLAYLVIKKNITPILDLMHYGTPLWLDNSFINHDYPEYVAEFAGRTAERYQSLVTYYTPLNEPMVNAAFCGKQGEWPPYLTGDDGYFKLLFQLAKGIVRTVQRLKEAQPGARTIQVEALWFHFTLDDSIRPQVEEENARQWLCLDLTTGRVNEQYPLFECLARYGYCQATQDWFAENAIQYDVLGVNFYPWSSGEMVPDSRGSIRSIGGQTSGSMIGQVMSAAYARYGMPLMVTETSALGNIATRRQWMDQTIDAVKSLRQEGMPVIGYTWFPLFSMIDWKYRRGRKPSSDYLIHLGLYEASFNNAGTLMRNPTRLVNDFYEKTRQPI